MRLLTTFVFLAAAGCVGSIGSENPGDGGDDDDTTDPDKMGRKIFKSDVHPVLLKCSGAACHETTAVSAALTKWYTADGDASYQAATTQPGLVGVFESIAPIITKIEAGHQNITYTPDEKSKIVNWLAVETEERKGTTPMPPPVDPKALLREWSGCISLENFNAANMTQAWSQLAGDDLRKCLNCHNGGVDGFLISANAQQFYDGITQNSAFLLKYFAVDTVNAKIVVNTGSFMNANIIQNHPTFPVETNAGMIALKALYESTLARKAAGQCDPPRLKD